MTQALDLLGIRNLLLGIHDAAFPAHADEDVGRGTPYSAGAADFIAFVAELGFTGVQLGPQGATSPGNPSPYDGTLFSRNPLSLALGPLTRPEWGSLLPEEELAELARRYDLRPSPAYADACHLCDESRRLLRSRFPELLTPDQMYGVAEGG